MATLTGRSHLWSFSKGRIDMLGHTRGFSATAASDLGGESEAEKTSIIIETGEDTAGLLRNILKVFEQHNINILHLESRMKSFARSGPYFLVDFAGSAKDQKLQDLMEDLQSVRGVIVVDLQP